MADITITTHPAQLVVSLRRKIDAYQFEHLAWEQLMAAVQEQGIDWDGAPCGATYHDEEYRESDIDIEVWEPVAAGTTAAAPLELRELPEQKVAVATVRGDYSQLGDPNSELAEYIAKAGLRIAGPMYNRYLAGPADTQDPSEYVTEVCVPIA